MKIGVQIWQDGTGRVDLLGQAYRSDKIDLSRSVYRSGRSGRTGLRNQTCTSERTDLSGQAYRFDRLNLSDKLSNLAGQIQ